ncbi:hypothetical protein OAP13_04160 [Gammaproteobacteria bacterium]|nr:hypothetical protein [Gammaproteobacteria bacterium]
MMITLILVLISLNTILILYFHWQQEQRNIEVIDRLKRVEQQVKDSASILSADISTEAFDLSEEIRKSKT